MLLPINKTLFNPISMIQMNQKALWWWHANKAFSQFRSQRWFWMVENTIYLNINIYKTHNIKYFMFSAHIRIEIQSVLLSSKIYLNCLNIFSLHWRSLWFDCVCQGIYFVFTLCYLEVLSKFLITYFVRNNIDNNTFEFLKWIFFIDCNFISRYSNIPPINGS